MEFELSCILDPFTMDHDDWTDDDVETIFDITGFRDDETVVIGQYGAVPFDNKSYLYVQDRNAPFEFLWTTLDEHGQPELVLEGTTITATGLVVPGDDWTVKPVGMEFSGECAEPS